jgi:molybdopterin-containing oxidoreductase family iron-sulfur binding subunit
MSARAHAHLLGLYDPARVQNPIHNLLNEAKTNRDEVPTTYEKIDAEVIKQLKKGKVAILSGSIVSPSLNQVVSDFSKSTGAKVYKWEPLSQEQYVKAQDLSYGENVAPRLALDKAKMVVAVNNDFLGTFLQPTQQAHLFAKTRKPGADMSQLVVFETLLSLTGANADSRFRIRSSQSSAVILGLLHSLIIEKKVSSYAHDGEISNLLNEYANVEQELNLPKGTLAQIAEDLWAARGKALVLGGGDLASNVAANLLNSALESDGATVDYKHSPNMGFQGSTQSLNSLIKSIEDGNVQTLIIHNVNPGYSAPAKAKFIDAIKKVEMVIYTGDRNDETGKFCNFIVPDHHSMEGWGDSEGQKGIYAVQQPTIRPLYNTRAFGDSLITWGKSLSGFASYSDFHTLVKSHFENKLGKNWITALQDGVVDTLGASRDEKSGSRTFKKSALDVLKKKETPSSDLELVLYATVGLKDGSLGNISWLHEFPDPVTKICWDNYLSVSPKIASEKNLTEGQIVQLTVNGNVIKIPAHIQPGQNDNSLGLALGYGRTDAGEIGNGVGTNAFALAGFNEDETHYAGLSATIEATSETSKLACTQGHNYMMGRQIIVEATLDQYKKNPESNIHRHHLTSAWSGHEYTGHKWGMSIDLSLCTGCSACVIACQSENNVPVVGKKYVLQGRAMHWIRLDRYYVGDDKNPDSVHMPVLCQHCDNAPCETVCPVAATMHSNEGTNDMIYNRCVGTRYCANNCPYKVRRFNWFNYSRMAPNLYAAPLHMQLNPEVTVRARGVMEKCSFCTHKIHQAKYRAKLEDRPVKDGDVVTACQSSCPTEAIVFGDLNDPNSKLSIRLKDTRHYSLLEDLNTRPAIQYASKIRNSETLKGEHSVHEGAHAEKGGHS